MSEKAFEYQDIETEKIPDMGEGVEVFGSRDYAEGVNSNPGEIGESVDEAVERGNAFVQRKMASMAVRMAADAAGSW